MRIARGLSARRDGVSPFVDHAPVHLITTATVGEVGTEYVRYRPNLLIETPPGTRPYVENDWAGGEIRLGDAVVVTNH